VHLIIVRDDLAYIIHEHPPVGPNGLLRQTVTFPAPGPHKVLVDVYPDIPGGQPNFQLYRTVNVAGSYHPKGLPAFQPDLTVDAYHFAMRGHPSLHAIQAQFINVQVTDHTDTSLRSHHGSGRSHTRSSSGRDHSTTSTPTSARQMPPTVAPSPA
jgi:hypothetical protein